MLHENENSADMESIIHLQPVSMMHVMMSSNIFDFRAAGSKGDFKVNGHSSVINVRQSSEGKVS